MTRVLSVVLRGFGPASFSSSEGGIVGAKQVFEAEESLGEMLNPPSVCLEFNLERIGSST